MVAKRRALADRRRRVGHTQEALATILGVERSTVVRWEAGDTEPLSWCRPKLAEALAVSLDELGELLVGVEDPPALPSDALLLSGLEDHSSAQVCAFMERFTAMDIASRREVLQELLIMSGAALLQPVRHWVAQVLLTVPLISQESVSNDAVDALESAVTLFRRWDASGAGGLHRKAVTGQLNALTETLYNQHGDEVSRRLFHVAAELAQLAGWMAYDQGLPGVAQRYYLLGLSACREAQSPVFGAKILGDMSRLSRLTGNYEDGLNLVQAGLFILPRHNAAMVRAELLGLESRCHAHLLSQVAATRAVRTCVDVWQETYDENAEVRLDYMNQAEVDCLAASTYIELALDAEDGTRADAYAGYAEQYTINAYNSREDEYNRSRILDKIRLAKVRLAQRDLAEAISVANFALELAASTSSTLICNSVLRFRGELTERYPENRHVIRFGEQVRSYVRQATPCKERDIVGT